MTRTGIANTSVVARLVSSPAAAARFRPVVVVVALVIVTIIGVIDAATGATLALGVFYLVPVAFGTVALGTAAGAALAVVSAVVWGVADARGGAPDPVLAVHIANGVFRTLIFLAVVVLLAGLRAALDDARASDQRSRQFLAFAAHQLRTPIAGVRSATDALLAERASPQQERLLRHIAQESARSGRLVAALLRMARLDQGEVAEPRTCDPIGLLRDEVERVSESNPHLDVRLTVDPSVPERARLSPEATREALGNLLDNARRHAVAAIVVSASVRDGALEVGIRDDGAGIPLGTEERVFEPFVSLDDRGGSGLGLPIARGLARQQGGGVSIRQGAFVLTLPLR